MICAAKSAVIHQASQAVKDNMSNFASHTDLSDMLSLFPVEDDMAHEIGQVLATIDPWAHYDYPAYKLIDFLKWKDSSTRQYAIIYEDELAGTVAIRNPWLQGPYLQLLGLFPDYQSLGIGRQILHWLENEARGNSRNLWVVASEINTRAIAFYERHGYSKIALLDSLVKEEMNEILLRKRI